jgi:hypothetical protein
MSTTLDLLYRWDVESGRMRLEARGVRLDERVRRQLEQAIRAQYPGLLQRLDRHEPAVTVRLKGFGPPTLMLVRYADSGRARNPSLILTPVEQADAGEAAGENPHAGGDLLDGPTRAELLLEESEAVERTLALNRSLARRRTLRPWIDGLMEDLEYRFRTSNPNGLSKMDHAALEFAVREFQTLCRERPDDLAVVVLAGYVALCEGNSRGGDSEEAALYALAARGMERLFVEPQDPNETPMTAGGFRQRNQRDGTLRRISRMLARLLGLDDF